MYESIIEKLKNKCLEGTVTLTNPQHLLDGLVARGSLWITDKEEVCISAEISSDQHLESLKMAIAPSFIGQTICNSQYFHVTFHETASNKSYILTRSRIDLVSDLAFIFGGPVFARFLQKALVIEEATADQANFIHLYFAQCVQPSTQYNNNIEQQFPLDNATLKYKHTDDALLIEISNTESIDHDVLEKAITSAFQLFTNHEIYPTQSTSQTKNRKKTSLIFNKNVVFDTTPKIINPISWIQRQYYRIENDFLKSYITWHCNNSKSGADIIYFWSNIKAAKRANMQVGCLVICASIEGVIKCIYPEITKKNEGSFKQQKRLTSKIEELSKKSYLFKDLFETWKKIRNSYAHGDPSYNAYDVKTDFDFCYGPLSYFFFFIIFDHIFGKDKLESWWPSAYKTLKDHSIEISNK